MADFYEKKRTPGTSSTNSKDDIVLFFPHSGLLSLPPEMEYSGLARASI